MEQQGYQPSNIEAEQAVLGIILGDAQQFWKICEFMKPEYFSETLHAELYTAAADLVSAGSTGGLLLLLNTQFKKNDRLASYGGGSYLANLLALGSSVMDIRTHATAVEAAYKRRQMLALADRLKILALDETRHHAESWRDVVVAGQEMLDSGTTGNTRTARQVFTALTERLGKELSCDSTGLPSLDKGLGGGLYAGMTYCFAGAPKAGKSTLMGSMSNNLGLLGVPHLYIAAEMSSEELHARAIARDIGRGSMAWITDRKEPRFIKAVMDYYRGYESAAIYHDAPSIHFNDLKMAVLSAVHRRKIRGVFLDYFQLVTGQTKAENQTEFLCRLTQWIATVARQEGIWVVYAAQLNDDGSVRGGKAAAMSADQVWAMEKPADDEEDGALVLRGQYSRYTPGGDVTGLMFDKHGPHIRDRWQEPPQEELQPVML